MGYNSERLMAQHHRQLQNGIANFVVPLGHHSTCNLTCEYFVLSSSPIVSREFVYSREGEGTKREDQILFSATMEPTISNHSSSRIFESAPPLELRNLLRKYIVKRVVI
jgi:hypothetical protein